jgi:hypothetical protein
MRLHEHPDFRDVVVAVAAEREISEQIAEKDYYVTEVLRIVAADLGEWGIFKGGTSLSKGWGLIRRFSEDIDLFVNPLRGAERLSSRGIDRELKRVHERVAAHPALEFVPEGRVKVSGKALHDRYNYPTLFPEPRHVAPHVLLESGVFSGVRRRRPACSVPTWATTYNPAGWGRWPTIPGRSLCSFSTSGGPSWRSSSPSTPESSG